MIDQKESSKELKSLKQISQSIMSTRFAFQVTLLSLNIPQMLPNQDLALQPTLPSILASLPPQTQLKQMLSEAQQYQKRKAALKNYKGEYKIVKKAAQTIDEMKYEAQRIYYLTAKANPIKLNNDFQENKGKIKLKSLQLLDQDTRQSKLQRNMLSPTYTPNIDHPLSQFLPNYSPLLTLSIYSSLSGEKQHGYLCHIDQTLEQVVSKFQCVVAKLEGREGMGECFIMIQEGFYYSGTAKKKVEEVIAFSNKNKGFNERKAMKYEMSKTALKSLRIIFGRPYLFRHLSGCDHMLIFHDFYLSSPLKTLPGISEFPVVVFQAKLKRRKCEACKEKFASIVALGDEIKSGKAVYLCSGCHQDIHGGREGVYVQYVHD